MFNSKYVPPTVTVDSVILQVIDNVLSVCLVQRGNKPFKDAWALPGGYSAEGETTQEALNRIVKRKAGISLKTQTKYTEQLYTFDAVVRDPRGHAVSISYLSCGLNIQPANATETVRFFPVDQLPELAFDHSSIIRYAQERLTSKISYTNVIFSLLDAKFTLSELQAAYEAVFGKELDKRNFRKKFAQLNLVKETGEMQKNGAHRPAKLYKFKSKKLETLTRSFD